MSLRSFIFSSIFVTLSAVSAFAEAQLVMVEEDGCMWCARWNEEISQIYPKTPEGRAAPLRRLDIHDARPDDLEFERSLHFTPTFVLMVDGKEASRLEGYPGEDFFWGLLQQMLGRAEVDYATN
ncbi:hypothetical protein [Sulfitobacter donghicola]|uniref:Regulatory protein n=1 Tax=Sulfitobacter donghicola DSW-25 = KCTC 12864 = JCM 14565 TaxID=1300350 RepID=A0A073IGU4_9RHOB|nr:hypothetical protein [Sulfitobacter donghicola]KEJ89518.1 regulatory protein [Sulfitobacter donghicola DSW-25 = KCTC 12864 = JCM 14565]KIN69341.1 Regulatory protein SoxS [Sulfitobacter donghicola DSW-25 = KCTC 12864 = JCM 14565]